VSYLARNALLFGKSEVYVTKALPKISDFFALFVTGKLLMITIESNCQTEGQHLQVLSDITLVAVMSIKLVVTLVVVGFVNVVVWNSQQSYEGLFMGMNLWCVERFSVLSFKGSEVLGSWEFWGPFGCLEMS
jgi:hypothetical protein